MLTLRQYINEVGVFILFLIALHLLDPFSTATLFGYALVFVLLVFKGRSFLQFADRNTFWILVFGLTYSMFQALGPNKGVQFLIIQSVFPIVFYLLGKYLVRPGMRNKDIVNLLLFIGVLFSFTSLLSVGNSLLSDGFVDVDRNIPNFWTGKEVVATGLASYLVYNLLIPGVLLANKKEMRRGNTVFYLAIYFISILSVFRLGSRMSIAITAIGLLVGVFFLIRSQYFVENIRFFFGSALLIFLILRFVPFDINADYLSVLGERLTDPNASSVSTAGNRTALWNDALNKLFKYPLGWESEHFAHNVWLDIARVAGIFPLIFFLINNLVLIRYLFIKTSFTKKNVGLSSIFILYFLTAFLVFFSEPILEGSFYAVTLFFMFQGIYKRTLEIDVMGANC